MKRVLYISFRITTFLLTLWICGYIGFSIYVLKMPETKSRAQSDAIVVLTGGGTHRIKEALALHAGNISNNIFITGVHSAVTLNDIRTMYTSPKDLPECCITLGHQATTTIENAQETKAWAKDKNLKSIRLVTSAYHIPRAWLEFSHSLKNVKIIPHPVKAGMHPVGDPRFWRLNFKEYNKFLYRFTIINLGIN